LPVEAKHDPAIGAFCMMFVIRFLIFWIYLLFGAWSLGFVCILVLVICIFGHKNPRQSYLSLIWPRGTAFQWKTNISASTGISISRPGRTPGWRK
jgi:hypothetical protein